MNAADILLIVASMFGGLALFLFGMNTMSKALSTMTGGVLDRMLGVVTKNRFTAFLFATGMTAVVQSSSAVSVLTVGLVNSGMIKMKQAVGLLIGAALGSTATAWLLSLNALDGGSLILTLIKPSTFSPFLAIIGVALTMFAKKERTLNIGYALLGFAVMMIGMNLMSQGVAPLKELPALQSMLLSFTNPLIGFLFAMLFTMLIQSSDATIGIVQAFALSVGVSYGMAIPLICGAQVGTCITALISSLGTSNNGKRTALMNLYYALLKVIPFMILFYVLDSFLHFQFLQNTVGGTGIPVWHSLINLFGAAIWIPGGGLIIKLAEKTIPYSEAEKEAEKNKLRMLDEHLLGNTSIALNQTDAAVKTLAETVGEEMQLVLNNYNLDDLKDTEILTDRVRLYSDRVVSYADQIDGYIAKMSVNSANTKETAFIMLLSNASMAFSEIGSITGSFVRKSAEFIEKGGLDLIGDTDRMEIRMVGKSIDEILELTIMGYETKDVTLSGTIQLYREEVMKMSDILRTRHYRRSHGTAGRLTSTTVLADISYTLDRLIDYCDIVADLLIKYDRAGGGEYSFDPEKHEKAGRRIHDLFLDKYKMLGLEEDEEGHVTDLLG